MDNTTSPRIDQLQSRNSSGLVALTVCKREDFNLVGKGVAFPCPFVLIVFGNVN